MAQSKSKIYWYIDLPINSMVIFDSYVNVYQAGYETFGWHGPQHPAKSSGTLVAEVAKVAISTTATSLVLRICSGEPGIFLNGWTIPMEHKHVNK